LRYRIKGWSDFQHYKDRKPPWIKLHRSLLDDPDFFNLSDAAKATLPMLWLIASDYDGYLPSVGTLAWRLRVPQERTREVVEELCQAGFVVDQGDGTESVRSVEQDASKALARRSGNSSPRREETETETETEEIPTPGGWPAELSEGYEEITGGHLSPGRIGKALKPVLRRIERNPSALGEGETPVDLLKLAFGRWARSDQCKLGPEYLARQFGDYVRQRI